MGVVGICAHALNAVHKPDLICYAFIVIVIDVERLFLFFMSQQAS